MKKGSVWQNAKKKWPKWGDLIWAHFSEFDSTYLVLVGGFNSKPDHFFQYDEGQWKGMGSQTNECDRWCYAEPPEYENCMAME